MEQICDYLSLSEAYGKKPSFTALVRERFSDDILAEIDRYCRLYQVEFSSVTFRKVIVTNIDIGASHLYFDALYICTKEENGKKQKVEMVVDCCCNLNDEFATVHTRGACPTWDTYRPKSILTDDLIPVISKKDLDRIAAYTGFYDIYSTVIVHLKMRGKRVYSNGNRLSFVYNKSMILKPF